MNCMFKLIKINYVEMKFKYTHLSTLAFVLFFSYIALTKKVQKQQIQVITYNQEDASLNNTNNSSQFFNQSDQEQSKKSRTSPKNQELKRRHLQTSGSRTLNKVTPEDLVRKFSFNYSFVSYQQIKKDLDYQFKINLEEQAGKDTYDYKALINTDFETAEQRAMYFYKQYKPAEYKIDFPNPRFFKIEMKVDPCRNKGSNDLCCDGSNEAVCEDNPSFISGTDIGVAWLTSGYVMRCSDIYKDTGKCGTFIEIHKPNRPEIVEQLQILSSIESGFSTEFISTKNLCAGRYEFWFVLRTRNGSILQHVKPFYSEYPPCSAQGTVQ
eukprot:403358265